MSRTVVVTLVVVAVGVVPAGAGDDPLACQRRLAGLDKAVLLEHEGL
jgi:hypothetical protein